MNLVLRTVVAALSGAAAAAAFEPFAQAWLVLVAAINTVASLFYYLRWIAPAVAGVPAEPSTREGAPGAGPRTAAGTVHKLQRGPVEVLHAAAVFSLLLGVGAGVWLGAATSGM